MQAEADAAHQDLLDLYDKLPHRPMPLPEPYTDYQGNQHEASPGWSEEDQAAVDALWARWRDATGRIMTHDYWATVSGNVPAARMALKRAHGQTAEGAQQPS